MRRTIIYYLNKAKALTGSDYRTAAKLGITRQAISHARRRRSLGVGTCIALAAILGVPQADVIEASYWQKERKARASSHHSRNNCADE